MKDLNLTLKKQWFDEILSGTKKDEYREIKWYWIKRLFYFGLIEDYTEMDEIEFDFKNPLLRHDSVEGMLNYFDFKIIKFDRVIFKNGYAKDAPYLICEWKGLIIDNLKTPYVDGWVFSIKLGDILESGNIK